MVFIQIDSLSDSERAVASLPEMTSSRSLSALSLPRNLESAFGLRRQVGAIKHFLYLRLAPELVRVGYGRDGVRHALVIDVADAQRLGLRRDHLLFKEINEAWLLNLRFKQRFDVLQHGHAAVWIGRNLNQRAVDRAHEASYRLRLLL